MMVPFICSYRNKKKQIVKETNSSGVKQSQVFSSQVPAVELTNLKYFYLGIEERYR
jgi:hypothetical protein